MKKADFLNLIFFFTGLHIIRSSYFKIKRMPVARFLAFHDIPSNVAVQFENNIRLLKMYTNVVNLNDFLARRVSVDKVNTVITFDDGYKSWVDIVIPILKKYDLRATFFISSGAIKTNTCCGRKAIKDNALSDSDQQMIQNVLTMNDVINIKENGHLIGGHTVNHISLKSERNISIIRREILEDKLRLEEIIKTPVKYFAYPFGDIDYSDIECQKVIKDCGYQAAVTLNPGFNSVFTDSYYLHRDIVWGGLNTFVFLSRSLGNRDILLCLKRYIQGCLDS
jgi:peptidoglycan/xylan/chitin deacetylase (PgdA/CDA1 family)